MEFTPDNMNKHITKIADNAPNKRDQYRTKQI